MISIWLSFIMWKTRYSPSGKNNTLLLISSHHIPSKEFSNNQLKSLIMEYFRYEFVLILTTMKTTLESDIIMKNRKNEGIKSNRVAIGLVLGVGFGLAVGSAIGNIGAGLAIGIALGIAVGTQSEKESE